MVNLILHQLSWGHWSREAMWKSNGLYLFQASIHLSFGKLLSKCFGFCVTVKSYYTSASPLFGTTFFHLSYKCLGRRLFVTNLQTTYDINSTRSVSQYMSRLSYALIFWYLTLFVLLIFLLRSWSLYPAFITMSFLAYIFSVNIIGLRVESSSQWYSLYNLQDSWISSGS